MKADREAAIGFWRTVWLLAQLARRRSIGRGRRQQQLLNNRSGREATNWGSMAIVFAIGFMGIINCLAARNVVAAVETGGRIEAGEYVPNPAAPDQPIEGDHDGKLVVSRWFLEGVKTAEARNPSGDPFADEDVQRRLDYETRDIGKRRQLDQSQVKARLAAILRKSGSAGLFAREDPEPAAGSGDNSVAGETRFVRGLKGRGIGTSLGAVVFLLWFAMLVCQGDGVDLDVQRRRHPMWEWLMSHPVQPAAVFLAEMLTPLAANPIFWTAPLFAWVLYAETYDFLTGMLAAVVIGVPLVVAAACLGKSIEIAALLRLPPRSRGAVIGLVGWFGFVSMLAMLFLGRGLGALALAVAPYIRATGSPSWGLLPMLLGLWGGQLSFLAAVLFAWTLSAVLIAIAVAFSAGSVKQGIAGAFASDTLPTRRGKPAAFGRHALFKKEALWFLRDRSALVQAVLIPVSLAGFQLFNLRNLFRHLSDSWNYLAGGAIFFGTYFLFVLGPKSLLSDGSALWLALTWPRGLEGLLKAKAWLWAMIATGLVSVVLVVGAFMFPHDVWKLGLVGIAWYFFARSMAEKSVTLVTVVSESGEAQKIPTGRRWAAQLGMLTFAIGVCTSQWNLAIVGIVYSWITAAAMWENLRARLPYLFDPWSEKLPEPPTLMHAMVSISIMIECAAVISAPFYASGAREAVPIGLALGYAVSALCVSGGVASFLAERGVPPGSIWLWHEPEDHRSQSWFGRFIASNRSEAMWLAWGIGIGLLLGLAAHGYVYLARQMPFLAPVFEKADRQMAIPGFHTAYAIIAIGFAPFAEEFLFRGLLYRTLDRHWGGWKAIAGASAFFAIYHHPTAWLPVATLGAANCILFRRSRSLSPAVLLHMTYNAVVTAL